MRPRHPALCEDGLTTISASRVRRVIGAVILGLFAGYLGRLLTPGSGIRGCLPTTALGLVGSLVGYLIFTEGLGIGDTEALDLGGLPGAVLGTVIVLALVRAVAARRA
jgi:uncharacterized membrane protein YeaQ/YmgE (transglycosylase-associated protein family)